MPDGADQTIKRGRKFDQVLDGARDIFLRVGFEGASVDEIAKAAQVSKATLYSYFPDKRLLFMEVARVECKRQADHAIETADLTAPIGTILHDIAIQLVNFVTSDFGQRMFRISVAEADRFPELGRTFYASGPQMIRDRLVDLLAMAVDKGELVIDDMPLAADQFAELCKADLFPRIVLCITDTFTAAEKERVVSGAVDTFMARYGATS